MAKKKRVLQKKAEGQKPPRLFWRQQKDGMWVPVVEFANIVMPLTPRPYQGFAKNERDAILVWIKQALSEILFNTPRLLVNPETGKCAPNPDWELLPYFEPHPTEVGTYVEVFPEPGEDQVKASHRLPEIPK